MAKNKMEILKEHLPETAGAFEALIAATFADGALTAKTKELIAVGVAVSMGCNDCMEHHIAEAKRLDATGAEIAEAMSVGFEMGAGRLFTPMTRALEKLI